MVNNHPIDAALPVVDAEHTGEDVDNTPLTETDFSFFATDRMLFSITTIYLFIGITSVVLRHGG